MDSAQYAVDYRLYISTCSALSLEAALYNTTICLRLLIFTTANLFIISRKLRSLKQNEGEHSNQSQICSQMPAKQKPHDDAAMKLTFKKLTILLFFLPRDATQSPIMPQ